MAEQPRDEFDVNVAIDDDKPDVVTLVFTVRLPPNMAKQLAAATIGALQRIEADKPIRLAKPGDEKKLIH